MKKPRFKIGDTTPNVWAGDFVTVCEYLGDLGQGRMLFWDVQNKCFRRVFVELTGEDDRPVLNGWDCANRPSELL